jgi:hypothetical protein
MFNLIRTIFETTVIVITVVFEIMAINIAIVFGDESHRALQVIGFTTLQIISSG